MSRALIERRLTETSDRLRDARRELEMVEEQLAHLAGDAEEARLRSLVSETPLATQEHREAARHAEAMSRQRVVVVAEIERLETSWTSCSTGSSPADLLARRQSAGRASPIRASSCERLRSARGFAGPQYDAANRGPPTDVGARSPPQERSRLSIRVVIAEDEAIIRLDLKETLEEEGYEVVGETGRGDEAVELVRTLEPDVAILDMKMPGLDGLSAAREITGERLAAVLILTAFSQRDLIEQARDAGALAYLVKPFQRSELVPGARGRPGPVPARSRRCTTRPRASRSSSRPASSSTGPRAG